MTLVSPSAASQLETLFQLKEDKLTVQLLNREIPATVDRRQTASAAHVAATMYRPPVAWRPTLLTEPLESDKGPADSGRDMIPAIVGASAIILLKLMLLSVLIWAF